MLVVARSNNRCGSSRCDVADVSANANQISKCIILVEVK